jgi:hypothetical protein
MNRDVLGVVFGEPGSVLGDWAVATCDIRMGQPVIQYFGELINGDEANRRRALSPNKHRYIMHAGIPGLYIDGLVWPRHIKSNTATKINHACISGANLILEKIIVGNETRMVFFAKNDIKMGDQLTFVYGYLEKDNQQPCECSSVGCNKTIAAPKRAVQKKRKCKPTKIDPHETRSVTNAKQKHVSNDLFSK